MSHNTMNEVKINPEPSKNLAKRVIINAWDKSMRRKETNKPTTLTKSNKTPPLGLNQCLKWIDHSKANSQGKNPTLTQTHAFSATRGLVYSSATEQSGCASGRGTPAIGTSGGGTSGKWTSGSGTLGWLAPPANSPSSCCWTSISEMFPAAPASHRVGAAGRGCCGVTSHENSSRLSV